MASTIVFRTPSGGFNEIASDWQAPPFTALATTRMGWIEDQLQESAGWLEGQSAYKNLPRTMKIFDAVFEDKTRSTLITNTLKYNIRKFVETISEVREIAQYTSDAKQFKKYAEVENKLAQCIYTESQYARQLRKVMQYSTVMGRGYMWPHCKAEDYGYGERRIVFEPLGLIDVMPVQVPSSNDVQDAYANTIFVYMPVAEAHGRFPLFQADLQPVGSANCKTRVEARRLDYAETWRYGQQARNWGNLYCEIRFSFIRDLAINTYGRELPMGEPGTSWFYKVPYEGQEILAGVRGGQPFTRRARKEDCRIYPYLRLMISAKGMKTPMYDGPAFDWHGRMPAVQYDVDDWAWEGIGRSLVQDVGSIETTKRKIERKIDQVTTTSLNPPMGYDRTSVNGPKIENFDIFEENLRVGTDGEPKKTLQSLLPDEVHIDDKHFKFLEMLGHMEEQQLGINDLGSLANLKLNVGQEGMDKALETIGPVAKGIAAGMEASNAKIGYMLKFLLPQWMDTSRVIEYIGPDSLEPEIFDYEPNSLIPSHMPDEIAVGETSEKPSHYPLIDRARRFSKNLRLLTTPSTLLKITQMQEQLKWLQLKRSGAPISWATTLKKLDVQNYGEVPGNTEREKYINETKEELLLKAEIAQMAAKLGLLGDGGGEEGGGPGQGKGGGRKPSGKKPPAIKQKGKNSGNPRTTVTES